MKLSTQDDNVVELEISKNLEQYFKEIFEIEMIKGERLEQSNGMIYYKIQISDEKMTRLKKWWIDLLNSTIKPSIN